MNSEKLFDVLENIDEKYINDAKEYRKNKKTWLKFGSIAAAFVIVLTAITTLPKFKPNNTHESESETRYSEKYVYSIDEGDFSSYISGKVISEDKIGEKIDDVDVTGGWLNANGDNLSEEKLRAEIYMIEGISKNVAVALKFIDKGDALTTTHYYVIMNPEADLSSVNEYIIPSVSSYDYSEIAEE